MIKKPQYRGGQGSSMGCSDIGKIIVIIIIIIIIICPQKRWRKRTDADRRSLHNRTY
jgi:hypothetical protein